VIGVKIAMAGFFEHSSKNVVSIKAGYFLKRAESYHSFKKVFFSMDTEDKSKILDFSLRIHSADHLRRFYNSN